MRKYIKAAILILIILILSLFYSFYRNHPHILYPNNFRHAQAYIILERDYRFVDKWPSIKIGMNESGVVEILGKPDFIDRSPTLPQHFGHPEELGKIISNPNKSYWYHSGDFQICIVFDTNNRVSYINYGGS